MTLILCLLLPRRVTFGWTWKLQDVHLELVSKLSLFREYLCSIELHCIRSWMLSDIPQNVLCKTPPSQAYPKIHNYAIVFFANFFCIYLYSIVFLDLCAASLILCWEITFFSCSCPLLISSVDSASVYVIGLIFARVVACFSVIFLAYWTYLCAYESVSYTHLTLPTKA